MNRTTLKKIQDMEDMILLCYGQPQGDELPQVETVDDVITTLTGHTIQ
jgi:hypothetical protein